MEIQISETTKIELTVPEKIVGSKAYTVTYSLSDLINGAWIKGKQQVTPIYFDNVTYDQFRLSTTKQKVIYFLRSLSLPVDEGYLVPEERAIQIIQGSKLNETLKATLIGEVNKWLIANP
jgi:hypothetical protein